MKKWWRRVRPKVVALPIYMIVRAIGLTLRLKVEGFDEAERHEGGKVYSGWHGRTLIPALVFRNKRFTTIISHSRDGEMQNRIFTRFGFETIRGSTGRGGERALVESIRCLKKGKTMAFPPDGPRGPSGVIQPGIMMMARKSGAALFPVGCSARRRWLAPAWDKYMIPLPFSKAVMIVGEPVVVPAGADDEEVERCRLELQDRMHAAEREAERRMGHESPQPN